MNRLCQLKKKLVDDEPGVHHYRWACSNCGREYGPEFSLPHWSTIEIARSLGRYINVDAVPQVQPGMCAHSSSRRTSLQTISGAVYCAA